MASKEESARAAWGALTRLWFSDELHTQLHRAVEAAGLPHPGALKALMHLDEDRAPAMRWLAEQLRCDASYVTSLVDHLEDLELVERQVSPTDRRVKLVHLTPAGRAARDKARDVLTTPLPAFDRLTDAEATALARILGKLLG
ncbi:MAG TPA: MarR family transcriptional regulator [Acidimicrobiales bacterium]